MTAAALSAVWVGLLVGCWFGGYGAERFLASAYCSPLLRRLVYGATVLMMANGFFQVLVRVTQ